MGVLFFGTGYVGLISGACLAEVGCDLVSVDVDTVKVDNLNTYILSVWEAGLQAILKRNVADGRRCFADPHFMAAVTCFRYS
jgi:UDPglucose 6-dehydrogenase